VRGRAAAVWIALLGGGCGDTAASMGAADAGAGPRCVATGIADGSWLTAGWDESVDEPNCASVPGALRDPATPGRYVAGDGAIGEIRCEGLRPGAATVWARVRVRMLAANGADERACHCLGRWIVSMRVLIDGAPARSLDGLTGGEGVDPSCVRGPDVTQAIGMTVGADGRVHARLELGRCDRSTPTACVFLQGTGLSVEQSP
jgi:hypothetical protein